MLLVRSGRGLLFKGKVRDAYSGWNAPERGFRTTSAPRCVRIVSDSGLRCTVANGKFDVMVQSTDPRRGRSAAVDKQGFFQLRKKTKRPTGG